MERKPVVIAQEALEKEAAVCEQIKALWASRGRTPRAFVDTYGCQQNEADSERIRGMLRASGYEIVDTEEGADCIVINTCAIREHAETRVYGNVGALVHTKARHPEQKIFLCGCMMGQPQVVDRIKNSYRHVDGVFNPHELWRFPELLQSVLRTNKRIFAVDDSAAISPRASPSCARPISRRGCRSCTAATISARTASCRMCAGGSGQDGPRRFSKKSRASSRRAIRTLRF